MYKDLFFAHLVAKMSIKEEPKDEKEEVTPGLKSQPTKKEVKIPAQEIDGMRVRKEFEAGDQDSSEEDSEGWDNITEESDSEEDALQASNSNNKKTNDNALAILQERNVFEEGSNKKRKKDNMQSAAQNAIANESIEIGNSDEISENDYEDMSGDVESGEFESGDSDDVVDSDDESCDEDSDEESGEEEDWEEAMRSIRK
jgi:hypothetical protein